MGADDKTLAKPAMAHEVQLDPATMAQAVASFVTSGDISRMDSGQRARYYVQLCDSLGLNPATKPIDFLRLNGKEVAYVARGGTDQLAAIHRVNREIVEGPEVREIGGKKVVYAKCRATHPNGRVETSVATVEAADLVNALMKCETKAKRRATLSLLGLGLLDETELETIPRAVVAPTAMPPQPVQVQVTPASPPEREPGEDDEAPLPDDTARAVALQRRVESICEAIGGASNAKQLDEAVQPVTELKLAPGSPLRDVVSKAYRRAQARLGIAVAT